MRRLIGALLLSVVTFSFAVDEHPMSYKIPGGIAQEKTPMFVCFGWDDNAYVDAMVWADTLFKNKKNKDGSPARGTFFITAGLAAEHFRDVGGQTREELKAVWKSAYENGNEIGNHTYSHPNGGTKQAGDGSAGQNFNKDQWLAEMQKCQDSLTDFIGVPQSEIHGFRTPYLGVNQGDFDAQKAMGIKYDCSIEYGYGTGYDDHTEEGGSYWNGMANEDTRRKLFWPFTLENGWSHPNFQVDNPYAPSITAPGQWMFTVYSYLKPTNGEITGFDGNMWTSGMLKDDFYETLKYNFDLQRSGNKCPITINTHTDNYSEWSPGNEGQWKYKEEWQNRRLAIEMFLDYVLQFDDVRVVPFKDVITWINDPKPIDGTSVVSHDKSADGMFSSVLHSDGILTLNVEDASNVVVTLKNIQGRVVSELYSGKIDNQKSFNLVDMNIAKGMYLLNVTGDVNFSSKVIAK